MGGEASQAEKQSPFFGPELISPRGEAAGSDICFQQLVLSETWKLPLCCSSCVKQMTGSMGSCAGWGSAFARTHLALCSR